MKALSIKQPWAYLVAAGHKKYETRSWATNYRGPIMIHASAGKMTTNLLHLYDECTADFGVNHHEKNDWQYGSIIGMATLLDVHPINADFYVNTLNMKSPVFNDGKEYQFGDYSMPGRFAWEMQFPMLFDRPIPMKGNLGIWNYTPNSEQTLLSTYEAYKALKSIPG